MKWFFALNQGSQNFRPFSEMVKVAVHTAALHTSLVPHFLYDGEANELTDWLRNRGVVVIPCRSRLYNALEEIARARSAPHVLNIGAGAFLRTEIPRVMTDHGWTDEYVLYTDCDVMFLNEVVDYLGTLTPRTFAVGPEGDANDHLHMNTGVMLTNVRSMAADLKRFEPFMFKHLDALARGSWDQTAYMWFYNPMVRLMLACGVPQSTANRIFYGLARRGMSISPRWDNLPAEYNWKPYWGDYSAARIVHFHGPKPYEREILESDQTPPHLHHLKALLKGGYHELAGMWAQHLADAEKSTPPAGAAPRRPSYRTEPVGQIA